MAQRTSFSMAWDPTLLASFLAVAETRTVSAAAKLLHASQPAVSAHIQSLERQLGTALFRRSVRGMELSDTGRRLVDHARRIQRLVDDVAADLGSAKEPSGRLLLAASTTLAAHVVPPILAAFAARYPDVSIRMDVGNTDEILERVRQGRVPLGIVEGLGRAPQVQLRPFVDDEILPVSAPSVAARIRRPADLRRFPILWREVGSGTRAVLERALLRAGLTKDDIAVRYELGSTEAITSAVIAGMGVGFLSEWSIRTEIAQRQLVPLPFAGLRIPRTFRWAIGAGALSGLAALFFDFANRHVPRVR
ncbi:MAG TPA: LysR family transcriptional regulator [Vicinamibacterales bacterium]|nr:LysR family transcriptional regulator [Vicinamibacterales bacterium]